MKKLKQFESIFRNQNQNKLIIFCFYYVNRKIQIQSNIYTLLELQK